MAGVRADVEHLLNKREGLTFSNTVRLMHLLEFLLSVVCSCSWISLAPQLFEGEVVVVGGLDADGPDLSFACYAMHGTPAERRRPVNSQVSANERVFVCVPCNLLLKHPQLSHRKRGRKTDEKGTFVFCPFMLGRKKSCWAEL